MVHGNQQTETQQRPPRKAPPSTGFKRRIGIVVVPIIILVLVWAGFHLRSTKNPPAALEGLASFLGNPNVATLKITSEPDRDVTVYMDGQEVGSTPYSRKLSPGTYHYELRADGYRAFATNVTLAARTEIGVNVRLEALPVPVVLISNPIGAEIYREGKLLGKTPATLNENPGRVEYLFKLPGYEEAQVVTNAVGPNQLRLEVALRPILGWIEVISDPAGADIYRDGKPLGMQTPALIQGKPGVYQYELKHEGYEMMPVEDTVQAGKTNRRSYALIKSFGKEPTTLLPPPTWPTIRVQSEPPGAEIWKAGERTGKVTPDSFRVSPGSVSYRLKFEGYEDETVSTNALEGQKITLTASLKPLVGTIVVSSNPIGAEIFEGDRFLGKTPTVFTKKPGGVTYTLKMAGYDDQTVTGTVKGKEQVVVEAALNLIVGKLAVLSQPMGAEIIQDGKPTGKRTPWVFEARPCNATFELRLDGYDTVNTNASIEARLTSELSVTFVPSFRALTNSVGMGLVLVRNVPGTKKGCWVGKNEVTQEQYEKVMGDNPSPTKDVLSPVVNISWTKAKEFCQKLSEMDKDNLNGMGLAGANYDLPSEPQWEFYVADAKLEDSITSVGRTDLRIAPEPVTSHSRTNRLGIADVVGNVWEFCRTDKSGPVWRGGAFDARLPNVAHYKTKKYYKGDSSKFVGFRVVLIPPS